MSKFFHKTRTGVVICGAYGMENAGDDAVLSVICRDLRRLEKDIPITVLSRKPKATSRRFGVKAVHPLNVPRWLFALRGAKLFLCGGGSLLQDMTSRRSLWYYLFTLFMAKKLGCAVQLYGCGIGPLLWDSSLFLTRKVLNACVDAITLRDEDSLETLHNMAITTPRLLLAADPALQLESPAGEREQKFGMVVRPWPDFWLRVPAFAAAARHAWETYGLPTVLICMAPEDRIAAASVADALQAMAVPCSVSYNARRAGNMSLVLSMRLHGLIFALQNATPAAGVSYDPKVTAFCAEAGYPCLDLTDTEEDTLCRLVDEALSLDAESLSVTRHSLRRRELINARTAAEFLA